MDLHWVTIKARKKKAILMKQLSVSGWNVRSRGDSFRLFQMPVVGGVVGGREGGGCRRGLAYFLHFFRVTNFTVMITFSRF